MSISVVSVYASRLWDDVTYAKRNLKMSVVLHVVLGILGVLASQHLDKGMSLILVDDASLDGTVAAEDSAQLRLRAAMRC